MPPTREQPDSTYPLSDRQIETFRSQGFVHLPGVLSDSEVSSLEGPYQDLIEGRTPVEGKDFCDMSDHYEKDRDDYAIINVMLARKYQPALRGSVFEVRAASITAQLFGPDMAIDYDQLLAKKPGREDAVFQWHQDQAYWPATPDTRTATIWLALDQSTMKSGCMRFVPRSHLESSLRPHRPLGDSRESNHTLVTEVHEGVDEVVHAEIQRGDVTVHNERVVHGSGGNSSNAWRRAYVIAFRSKETISAERAMGFTHSHNDELDLFQNCLGDAT